METHAFLSELRAILHSPSPWGWRRLVALFDAAEQAGADVRVGVDYALGHLEAWPWRLREAPWSWVERALRREPPAMLRLAASLSIQGQRGLHTQIPRLLKLPHLVGLRGLTFDDTRIGGKHSIRALLGASYTPRLERLKLAQVGLRDDQLEMLLSASELARLEELHLERNTLTPGAIRRFEASPAVLGLRELHLDDNPLGAKGGMALAQLPFERLEALSLGKTQLLDAGVQALAQSAPLVGLRHLELMSCGVLGKGWDALAGSALGDALESLSTRFNAMNPRACAALGAPGRLSNMATLGMAACHLDGRGLRALLGRRGALPKLARLDLSHYCVDAGGMEALRRYDGGERFRTLLLRFNRLEARSSFGAWMRRDGGWPELERLDVSHTRMDRGWAAALAALQAPKLKRLGVSFNPIGDAGFSALFRAKGFPKLRVLGANGCGLGDRTLKLIQHVPSALPELGALHLSGNTFRSDRIAGLVRIDRPRLRCLELDVPETCTEDLRQQLAARYAEPPPLSVRRKEPGTLSIRIGHVEDFGRQTIDQIDAMDKDYAYRLRMTREDG